MTKKNFKEELWYLYGFRIENFIPGKKIFIGFRRYHSEGTEAEVSMDFNTANSPYVIGWYHTHPGVSNTAASSTDNRTMRSWVKAIYKTYICGIRCGNRESFFCYYVGGMSKSKTTIVKKNKIDIAFFGPFFFGML